jgi:putative flippase GtrA
MVDCARKGRPLLPAKQFLRFLVIGILNTAASYAIYAAALTLGFHFALANMIALIGGILIGFRTQGKYVFHRSESRLFWKFLVTWGLIYCFNIAFIDQLMDVGLGAYLAGAVALPFVVVLSFAFQKFFVFRGP